MSTHEEKLEIAKGKSTIVLTERESIRLLKILENPPPRNEKFLQAQARYQKVMQKNEAF